MGDYELELTAPGGTPVIERGTLYDLAVRVWEAPPGWRYVIVRLHDGSTYTSGVTPA